MRWLSGIIFSSFNWHKQILVHNTGIDMKLSQTIRISTHIEIHHGMAKFSFFILFDRQLLSQTLQCCFFLKKFIMRSQSGNYNYSKTFFPPLGPYMGHVCNNTKTYFFPLEYICFRKWWDVDLFTSAHSASQVWGNWSQSVGILKELWFRIPLYSLGIWVC